ncbi:Cysteine-rich small domain protein [uncultured archaeon]|nr:Cysteine-rich small domain protein [uncultured archaeon]
MERLNCERYPCHFSEQDCVFCFCPFYPCLDSRTGGRADGENWSCNGCSLIHNPAIAAAIMDALLRGEDPTLAWKRLEKLL